MLFRSLAMHLKLAGLAEGELPDFMSWSGTEALPWWWSLVKSPLAAVAAVLVVPTALGALMAWAIFRRRIGGVYFALITPALALGFAPLLLRQQGLTGGLDRPNDYQALFVFNLHHIGSPRSMQKVSRYVLNSGVAGYE